MASFLDEIDKRASLFDVTNGEIIQLFKFRPDVYKTFTYFLNRANSRYIKNCIEIRSDIDAPNHVTIKKDASGKSYLEVLGNDNRSILIIENDHANADDYNSITGYKIRESIFIEAIDIFQRQLLSASNLPRRFIREEIPPIDAVEEMDIPLLINYYEYLNYDYFDNVQHFDEPENFNAVYNKLGNVAPDRKHPVIDYDERYQELLRHDPFYTSRLEGTKTHVQYGEFVYERDGYVLAVVEPVSGMGYQFALNLGDIDKDNIDLINSMIKAAMEAKEDVVLSDDAIMRKSHTTMDVFKENLEIFLNSAKSSKKFYSDVEKSKEVYNHQR